MKIGQLDYSLNKSECSVKAFTQGICDYLNEKWKSYGFSPGKTIHVLPTDFDLIHKQLFESKKWIGAFE